MSYTIILGTGMKKKPYLHFSNITKLLLTVVKGATRLVIASSFRIRNTFKNSICLLINDDDNFLKWQHSLLTIYLNSFDYRFPEKRISYVHFSKFVQI